MSGYHGPQGQGGRDRRREAKRLDARDRGYDYLIRNGWQPGEALSRANALYLKRGAA